jgi:hypothetical protein
MLLGFLLGALAGVLWTLEVQHYLRARSERRRAKSSGSVSDSQ